jgi:hypothetical protein
MRFYLLLATVILGLSACGIKPSSVEPPEGSDGSSYPATYPNPSTEP